MGDFPQFYYQGGLFMHVVTATIAAAITCAGFARRAHARGQDPLPMLGLADRLAWICLAEGVAGALFGWFDMCAALRSLPPDTELTDLEMWNAVLRGLGIVPTTIVWSLMVTIPTWIAIGVLRVRFSPTSR